MPYLEIYPMENCADKIQKQLDEVISARPNMYAKTKKRYQELAITLLQSVEKITDILEQDSLASMDSDEFGTDSKSMDVSNISNAMKQASQKINAFEQFVSHPTSSSNANSINKETLSRYASVIEAASKHDFKFKEVNECAALIHKWFTTRFTPKVKNPNFKYNISQIPEWITNIIILYGKYHKESNTNHLIQLFDSWANDTLTNQSNVWAVPFEVHNLSKSVDPTNYTVDALVIGDILMDECLYLLTEEYSPGIVCNLDAYPVASAIKLKNPSLLPIIRTRLAKRNELIDECNLTSTLERG